MYKPITYVLLAIIMIIILLSILVYTRYSISTIGFIVTPILTIFFIIIWDGYNSKNKEETIFLNLKLEFSTNIITLIFNSSKLLEEFKLSEKKQQVVSPLKSLNTQIRELLVFNTPNILFKNNLLGELSGFYFLIHEINETMLSRENFRINNSGMSNFGSSLILYDEIIFSLIQRFIAHIEIILNTKELRKELNGVENLETHLATLKLQRDNIIKILDK